MEVKCDASIIMTILVSPVNGNSINYNQIFVLVVSQCIIVLPDKAFDQRYINWWSQLNDCWILGSKQVTMGGLNIKIY